MAPKKDKKKEEEANKAATFTEVEKEFLVLQIADLNRKVARLRAAVEEYEIRNEELQKSYDQLDEDRADIIAYLKKTLTLKIEENSELKEKVKGLEETREIETAQFKETVAELEKNFTTMKDQLTSENKLLAGKLNTLEEFRAVRDDLMRKFETQEQDFKDQETKYKTIIYEAEKKFTLDKGNLKKEMEARLLQLAQDFQDATELRIAASTHRLIRENIAINNELDKMLAAQEKLSKINEKYKESERAARVALELAEEERDKAMNKNIVQLKVIDKLTAALNDFKKEKVMYDKRNYEFRTLQTKVQELSKENENLLLQVRDLEQNLNTKINDQNKTLVETSKIVAENTTLKKLLKDAANAIRAALKLDEFATVMPNQDILDRQILLSSLLNIITQYREVQLAEPGDSAAPSKAVYKEGDLGFVPKPMIKRKTVAESGVPKESSQQITEIGTSSSTIISISPKPVSSTELASQVSDHELVVKERHHTFLILLDDAKSDDTYLAREKGEEDTMGIEKYSKAIKETKFVRIMEKIDKEIKDDGVEKKEEEETKKEAKVEVKGEEKGGERRKVQKIWEAGDKKGVELMQDTEKGEIEQVKEGKEKPEGKMKVEEMVEECSKKDESGKIDDKQKKEDEQEDSKYESAA